MRTTALLVPLSILALTTLAPPQIAPRSADSLHLVQYGQDVALRDRMIRDHQVFADLGGWVVVRLDAATAHRWTSAGRRLFAIPALHAGESVASWFGGRARTLPSGVRVLLHVDDLRIVAGRESGLRQLHQAGVFHGGIAPIDLHRPYTPAPPVVTGIPEANDPRITALVASVQQANLVAHIRALSALFTRRTNQPENAQAVTYIKSVLGKLPNLKISTHTFTTGYGPNVIAELRGHETPDEIVMVGAHLDSLAGASRNQAPGADDNASGSATVLELARIFAAAPMQRTIRFAFWNAEEYGLVGSRYYAADAKTRGDKIVAYLNTDMNAYRASGDTVDVDFVINDSTASLVTQLTAISKAYVPTLGVKSGYLGGGTSDHRSFFRNGFPAVFYFEDLDKYSPFIHTSRDDMVNSTNDMNLATLISQSITAGLASLSRPLDAPSFRLDVTRGPTIGGTRVTATGSYLGSAQSVKVAGKAIPFSQGTSVGFTTPIMDQVGTFKVEISNAAGIGTANFDFHLTSPPTLRFPAQLARGTTGTGVIGGTPGLDAVTLLSTTTGATNLGFVTLDIGGGNPAGLLVLDIARLSAGGGLRQLPLPVPNNPILAGQQFHFQAGVITPAPWSVSKTNPGTVKVQ